MKYSGAVFSNDKQDERAYFFILINIKEESDYFNFLIPLFIYVKISFTLLRMAASP